MNVDIYIQLICQKQLADCAVEAVKQLGLCQPPNVRLKLKGSLKDQGLQILDWWKSNAQSLPLWAGIARKVFAHPPSFVERIFSQMKSAFPDNRLNTLEDGVELTLMLMTNGPAPRQ